MTNLLGFLELYLHDLAKYRTAVREIEDELLDAEPRNRASKYVDIEETTYGRLRASRIGCDDKDLFPGLNESEIKAKVRSSDNLELLSEAADALAIERDIIEPYYYAYDDRGLPLPMELQMALRSWALKPKERTDLDMLAEYIKLGPEAYNKLHPPYTDADFQES